MLLTEHNFYCYFIYLLTLLKSFKSDLMQISTLYREAKNGPYSPDSTI